jgi:hypothetical protein
MARSTIKNKKWKIRWQASRECTYFACSTRWGNLNTDICKKSLISVHLPAITLSNRRTALFRVSKWTIQKDGNKTSRLYVLRYMKKVQRLVRAGRLGLFPGQKGDFLKFTSSGKEFRPPIQEVKRPKGELLFPPSPLRHPEIHFRFRYKSERESKSSIGSICLSIYRARWDKRAGEITTEINYNEREVLTDYLKIFCHRH